MARTRKTCPICESGVRHDRLQGRAPAVALHHGARQDPPAAHQRDVRAAPASAEHGDQARALPGAHPVHRGTRGLMARRPAEPVGRGGGRPSRSLLACGAMLLSLTSPLDAVPLVALPLALAPRGAALAASRWRWIALGVPLWALGVALPGRPARRPQPRLGAAAGGGVPRRDAGAAPLGRAARARCSPSPLALGAAAPLRSWPPAAGWGWTRSCASTWPARLDVAARQMRARSRRTPPGSTDFHAYLKQGAVLQWKLFPALLGLQSLAALALASWGVARLRAGGRGPLQPAPAARVPLQRPARLGARSRGLVLLVLPLGGAATRVGYNALFFMGGLYALRGLAVFALPRRRHAVALRAGLRHAGDDLPVSARPHGRAAGGPGRHLAGCAGPRHGGAPGLSAEGARRARTGQHAKESTHAGHPQGAPGEPRRRRGGRDGQAGLRPQLPDPARASPTRPPTPT